MHTFKKKGKETTHDFSRSDIRSQSPTSSHSHRLGRNSKFSFIQRHSVGTGFHVGAGESAARVCASPIIQCAALPVSCELVKSVRQSFGGMYAPILSYTVTKPNNLQPSKGGRYTGGSTDNTTSPGLRYEAFDAQTFPEECVWKVG